MAEYEYGKKRIIDMEETETINDDNYFLIDSPTQGMRCISMENISKGGND